MSDRNGLGLRLRRRPGDFISFKEAEALQAYLRIAGLFCLIVAPSLAVFSYMNYYLATPFDVMMEVMLAVFYVGLGAIMLLVSSHPMEHKSFIDFIIVSNVSLGAFALMFGNSWGHMSAVTFIAAVLAGVPLKCYPWAAKLFLRY